MIKNNLLVFSTLHKDGFAPFLKNIRLTFKKFAATFYYFNKKKCNKKMTILRSPHVNKSARDQISISCIKHFFIFRNSDLKDYFMFFFKKHKTSAYNFSLNLKIKQKVFLTFVKSI